jgi:alkylated DNA repair dioxygenase AlkB
MQPDLFGVAPPSLPDGFRYQPDALSPAEEQALIAAFAGLEFRPFEFHGYLGKRRVAFFGWRYDFTDRVLEPAEELPGFLRPARARAAEFAGLSPADLLHALITEYQPGAEIGWHRDRPDFDQVIGLSLLSPCRFRLRRRTADGWSRAHVELQPRSAYLLSGPARRDWEHSIPGGEGLRYSITFRSLRGSP